MDLNTAANALRELGHPTRLSIYRELVRAGHEGLPVGELQKHLEIPASTLSHHLSSQYAPLQRLLSPAPFCQFLLGENPG